MAPGVSILSTRKLNTEQRNLLLQAGCMVQDEDFIEVESLDFKIMEMPTLLLFTSQNAVKSVRKNEQFAQLKTIPALCVGAKTKAQLIQNGVRVLASRPYAENLRDEILPKVKTEKIAFFAGNRRLEILPEGLQKNNVDYTEYTVYKTELKPKKITATLRGILFYSPSGIESYLQSNTLTDEICFCIGTTTAAALQGKTDKIVIADTPDIDGVVACCCRFFSGNSGKN